MHNMILGNGEVQEKERVAIIDRLERFFRDILKHPQPRESALRIESSIYQATSTKEEYKRMIMNKMQYLQQQQLQQQQSGNTPTATANTNSSSASQKTLSGQEKQEMRTLLTNIQPKLPLIDKTIADNTRNQRLDPEMVRKFASLRNILVKQLGLLSADGSQDTFIMSPQNLAALVDQLLKMMAIFSSTTKAPEMQSAMLSKLHEFKRYSSVNTTEDCNLPVQVNVEYVKQELEYLCSRYGELEYFVNQIRSDLVRVTMNYNSITLSMDLDNQYPGSIKFTVNPDIRTTPMQPMSITSLFRHLLSCKDGNKYS